MKRCKTCKWWGTASGAAFRSTVHCGCNHPTVNDEAVANSAVAPYDGVCTGPEFGCVHHEEKQ